MRSGATLAALERQNGERPGKPGRSWIRTQARTYFFEPELRLLISSRLRLPSRFASALSNCALSAECDFASSRLSEPLPSRSSDEKVTPPLAPAVLPPAFPIEALPVPAVEAVSVDAVPEVSPAAAFALDVVPAPAVEPAPRPAPLGPGTVEITRSRCPSGVVIMVSAVITRPANEASDAPAADDTPPALPAPAALSVVADVLPAAEPLALESVPAVEPEDAAPCPWAVECLSALRSLPAACPAVVAAALDAVESVSSEVDCAWEERPAADVSLRWFEFVFEVFFGLVITSDCMDVTPAVVPPVVDVDASWLCDPVVDVGVPLSDAASTAVVESFVDCASAVFAAVEVSVRAFEFVFEVFLLLVTESVCMELVCCAKSGPDRPSAEINASVRIRGVLFMVVGSRGRVCANLCPFKSTLCKRSGRVAVLIHSTGAA